jgi:hypothetical protein
VSKSAGAPFWMRAGGWAWAGVAITAWLAYRTSEGAISARLAPPISITAGWLAIAAGCTLAVGPVLHSRGIERAIWAAAALSLVLDAARALSAFLARSQLVGGVRAFLWGLTACLIAIEATRVRRQRAERRG